MTDRPDSDDKTPPASLSAVAGKANNLNDGIEAVSESLQSAAIAQKSVADSLAPAVEAEAALNAALAPSRALQEQMEASQRHFGDITERMKNLAKLAGRTSTLGASAAMIAKQQDKLSSIVGNVDGFLKPKIDAPEMRMLDIPSIPPNPAHETNNLLEKMDNRFAEVQALVVEAAAIANQLQASAAEFLGKFEAAAEQNNTAAKRAIWLGAAAVFIAMAMPTAQIFYTELWRVPAESAATQASVQLIESTVSGVLAEQNSRSEQLEKIAVDNALALSLIADLLAQRELMVTETSAE